jgi:hypothetical protein
MMYCLRVDTYIYRGSLLETIEEGLTVRPLGGLV